MFKGWGGRWREPVNGKKTFVVVGIDLPKMLKEGEFHSEYTNEVVTRIDSSRIFTSGMPVAKNGGFQEAN